LLGLAEIMNIPMLVVSFESTRVLVWLKELGVVLVGRGGSEELEVIVDWDEERSEKTPPRWVSFNSVDCQRHSL
jgi:hypothetical protein